MPIRNAIWKVGPSPQLLTEGRAPSEKAWENLIVTRRACSLTRQGNF